MHPCVFFYINRPVLKQYLAYNDYIKEKGNTAMQDKDMKNETNQVSTKKTNKERATRERKERIERADKITSDLLAKGYVRKNATVGMVAANIWALVIMAPLMLLLWFGFEHFYPDTILGMFNFKTFVVIYLLDFVFIVIHELIHGLCMYIFNGHDKSTIDYGIHQMTPYCSCQIPLQRWQYYITLLSPTVILCGILGGIAFATGNLVAIGLALIMALGGGGDVLITVLLLLKTQGKDIVVLDHPCECGCYYFQKSA